MGKEWPLAEPEQDPDAMDVQLTLEDKELFLRAWDLKDHEMATQATSENSGVTPDDWEKMAKL